MVKKSGLLLLALPLLLCGCGTQSSSQSENTSINNEVVSYITSADEGTATIQIYKNNNSTSTERYIAPRNVELKYAQSSLNGLISTRGSVLPSIGDSKLLVIPCHLPGSTKYNNEKVKSDIEEAFFGTPDNYYSVAEYYRKSSYGKCNLTGTVTDWFDVSKTSVGDELANISETIIRNEIIEEAVLWAEKTQDIKRSDYDSNGDGFIDAVYLVYDHFDYNTVVDQIYKGEVDYDYVDASELFINYTLWTENEADLKNPEVSGYSWCSISSLYSGRAPLDENGYMDFSDFNSIEIDTNPFIHETGHLFGLNDYSNSDTYNPVGKFTMMDNMTGDLDSYSKLTLGWITPYVVYGSSKILVEKANKNDHSVIVIPSNFEDISNEVEAINKNNLKDSYKYSFNPFSEYMLIDLYTYDELNIDNIKYSENTAKEAGIRIYHVDSRLFTFQSVTYSGGSKLTLESEEWDGDLLNDDEILVDAITNAKTESSTYGLANSYNYLDEIRLVEATKLNSFSEDGALCDESLWKTSTTPFSITDFGYQFFNSNYAYDNGNEMPFNIKVKTLRDISHE